MSATLKNQIRLISLVFFLSGCAALVFEAVWFRIASLVLGSTVWSAAAVLMAFMAGLAIGNFLMALFGGFVTNPIRFYVIVEVVIGITGITSVFVLPTLSPLITHQFSEYTNPATQNLIRFLVALSVLVIPAIAMGMTLPLLQKLLFQLDNSFGRSLARLYGWNTVGAVCGVLLAEFILIKFIGLKSSALIACTFNLAAAFILLSTIKNNDVRANYSIEALPRYSSLSEIKFVLIAPFLTGFILLALEVVWFRYMLLAQVGTSAIFSIMLAIILAGIGLGGLITSKINTERYDLDNFLIYLPLLTALFVVIGLIVFELMFLHFFAELNYELMVFSLGAVVLMLPTSIMSGVLFPLYGEKIHKRLPSLTGASGMLTLANTVGATAGSGFATFLFLPKLGIEQSILLLSLTYFIVTLVAVIEKDGEKGSIVPDRSTPWMKQYAVVVAGAILIWAIFPHGKLAKSYTVFSDMKLPEEKLIHVKEGLNQTLQYYKKEQFGRPSYFRLVTNNYSMSATHFDAARYMKLYAYFPYVLHDNIQDVLQISYGVGNTAEALTSLESVVNIDIVDISEDILELSSIIHDASGKYPLRDARTTVHIEDGRFFLQTTNKRFDLITGEPPPPKNSGIVNLYSKEYFELLRSKLKPGGIVTYWLPVHALLDQDALAIIKGFCIAFSDCSLWNGAGLDFMLVGTKGGLAQVRKKEKLELQESLLEDLRDIGFDEIGQLGALFMADSKLLTRLTENVSPVTDNFPQRISTRMAGVGEFSTLYSLLLDINRRQLDLAESQQIKTILPQYIIDEANDYFRAELILMKLSLPSAWETKILYWVELFYLLDETNLRAIPLILLNSSPTEQRNLTQVEDDGSLEYRLAYIKRLIVDREFVDAVSAIENTMSRIPSDNEHADHLLELQIFLNAARNNLSASELYDLQERNPKVLNERYINQILYILSQHQADAAKPSN